MYGRSARYYELTNIARGKDYERESKYVIDAITARRPGARSLLDVACGTGAHLEHFREMFDIDGVEPAAEMRAFAAQRLGPDVVVDGDMRIFDAGRQYDAVTCLFSSIGYMLTIDDMRAAVANMARHLAPGGVLIVEPWFHPDAWIDGFVVADAANGAGVAVSRVSRSTSTGHLSQFSYHFTVADDHGVEVWEEPHELAMWTVEQYTAAFVDAGLTVEHDPEGLIGRGLFVGQRAILGE